MITLPSAAGPLYQAAVAPGGDPVACLLLADLHEEAGDTVTAAGWRWLARNAEVIHGDRHDPEDPWSHCVTVCVELLPAVVLYSLPISLLDTTEDRQTNRILPDLWVDRETFLEDFLAAWRSAHAELTTDFHLQSD